MTSNSSSSVAVMVPSMGAAASRDGMRGQPALPQSLSPGLVSSSLAAVPVEIDEKNHIPFVVAVHARERVVQVPVGGQVATFPSFAADDLAGQISLISAQFVAIAVYLWLTGTCLSSAAAILPAIALTPFSRRLWCSGFLERKSATCPDRAVPSPRHLVLSRAHA